jgi:hypothetical protein
MFPLPPVKVGGVLPSYDMKIIYDTYHDIFEFARKAFKGTILGVSRLFWVVILLAVNSARFVFLWLSATIKKKPMVTLLVFAGLLIATNSVNYISMKAKLNTSRWQYDTFRMHTDSIMEVYNINKNYTRITSYE